MNTPPVRRRVVVRKGAAANRGVLTPLLAALALAALGAVFLYAACQVWIGVHQAVAGPRVPGTVHRVYCPGAHSSCGGDFTSDDGTVRGLHVTVDGVSTSRAEARATLVRKVDTGLVDSVQSRDTAYVGGVTVSVVGISVIGVLLTGLGLVLCLPVLVTLLALLTGRRPRA